MVLFPRSLVVSGLGLVLAFGFAVPGQAELRYAPKTGTTHAYSVEIKAELPDGEETLKGVISYDVKESKGDQLKLEYRGGLNRSRKTKALVGGRPGFRGPRGPIRRGGPPNPFATPTFKGLTQTTNKLTLTSRGDVVALEGSSQLPYLLGNLSLSLFEPLPEKPQESWEVKNGIWISETNERQSFPRFGPRRPGFEPESNEGKRSAGAEAAEFKITKSQEDAVTVQKTYSLKSALADGKNFEIEGHGTWVFDEAKGLSRKYEFEQTLTVNLENVSLKVPISGKYEMLTEEQLAVHKVAQEKRQEEMKARLEEARKQGEARRKKPLTAAEKAELLERLGSDKFGEVMRGLNTLRFKDPQEPDAEIAAALKKLADHENRLVRRNAEQIGKKWAATPEEK